MTSDNTHLLGPTGDPTLPDRRSTRKVLGAVLAVALVPLGVVAVGHLPASDAQTTADVLPASAPPPMTKKWVAINTTANTITLNAPGGSSPLASQAISGSSCILNQGPAASQLLTFTGQGGVASFATGYLGVQEKKSGTGASCSQVNFVAGESLALSVGALTKATVSPGVLASSAYLDVDLKQGASIEAHAYRGASTTPVGTFVLQSGTSISGSPSATVRQCNPGADSGSDAKANDNCRWPISVPSWQGPDDGIAFDRLVLRATAGSFSLLGGSDGVVPDFPPTAPAPTAVGGSTVFELIDGTINCGGSTRTILGVGDSPRLQVTRLGNTDSGEPCVAVPYSLATDPDTGQFLKPLDTQLSAQFIWDVTWLTDPVAGKSDLPQVWIDFEVPDGAGRHDLGWCPDATYGTNGAFAGYTAAQIAALPDFEPTLSGRQYACLISRAGTSVNGVSPAPDQVSVRDLVYVHGDARLRLG